jgi:uncharacterized protein YcaQ
MPEPRPTRLSLNTARRLAVAKQHLAGKRPSCPGPDSIMGLMEDMRYLQLDPTAAVAPSHLLVLWSRLGAFRESDLDRLMWKDRKLFEYWAHRASIVLTEDYPFYHHRMRNFPDKEGVWYLRLKKWMDDNSSLRNYVLSEISKRGPLLSRDLEDKADVQWKHARRRWGLRPSAWSSGNSVRRMLEFLFHKGEVMVAGRQGRQKLWGLPKECLPSWTPRDDLSESEIELRGAQISLRALGVANSKQISWHFLTGRYPKIKATLGSLEGLACATRQRSSGEGPLVRPF